MTRHLQREVGKLKQKLLEVGKLVQDSLDWGIESIKVMDEYLAQRVIETDAEVDQREVDTEEECLKILALHQPVAIDLRFIIAALKANNDLERIGDLAVNIAEQTVELSKVKKIKAPFDLDNMTAKVQSMVATAMQAMVSMDTNLARQVCAADDEVDEIHHQMYGRVEEVIAQNPGQTQTLIRYLSVSRYLERIADHATNIAEDVIYMVEGEIARHHLKDG